MLNRLYLGGILVLLVCQMAVGQDLPLKFAPLVPGGDAGTLPSGTKQLYALEEPVDPTKYRLGPGDQLELLVFGNVEVRIPFDVSPDGIIAVPSVGAFKVDTLTLAVVDSILKERAAKVYPRADIRTRLLNVRYVMVSITGQVTSQGVYAVSALSRLSSLITSAGGFYTEQNATVSMVSPTGTATVDRTKDKYDGEGTIGLARKWFFDDSDPQRITPSTLSESENLPSPAYRRILITSRSGDTKRYDYQKFLNNGDKNHNPILQEGDVVHIPATDLRGASLFISGAVNLPGKYDFVEGDHLRDLIEIAGGFKVGALNESITLYRSKVGTGGDTSEELIVSLADVDPGIELKPQDQLFVRSQYDYKGMSLVKVFGEVKYPGVYPIQPEKTTLYTVIKQSGFPTKNADLSKARIIRWSVANAHDPEYYSLKTFGVENMSQMEASYYKVKNRFDPPTVNADFKRLFEDEDMSCDVELRNGDEIEIPFLTKTVNVVGFVKYPGLVPYKEGESFKYYIELAGGFAHKANRTEVHMLRSGTSKWDVARKANIIYAGDVIFVPEKDDLDAWLIFKDILLVLSQVTTVIIVVRNLGG